MRKRAKCLSQERAGEPWYPASLTKLMTAYIVFQKIREGKLQAGPADSWCRQLLQDKSPARSGCPLAKPCRWILRLQALLVYSANDMAYVLAEAASGMLRTLCRGNECGCQEPWAFSLAFRQPQWTVRSPSGHECARHWRAWQRSSSMNFRSMRIISRKIYVAVGKRHLANRNSLIRIMPEADGMKTGLCLQLRLQSGGLCHAQWPQADCRGLGARSGGNRAVKAQEHAGTRFCSRCRSRAVTRWVKSSTCHRVPLCPPT